MRRITIMDGGVLMPDAADIISGLVCPLPCTDHDCVLLGHGSGGRMSADLLQRIFLPAFDNATLGALEDQATICLAAELAPRGASPAAKQVRLAFSTDAFVVRPLFFPGGDSVREGLEFETILESDCAPLANLTDAMLRTCPGIRWMRDPTPRTSASSWTSEHCRFAAR